jgi:hypothetical protein
MPNRMVSFAVLLFSFAVAMLSYQPKAGVPIFTVYKEFNVFAVVLPVQWYWGLGSIAIAGSLFLIVVAFRKKCREKVEEVVTKRWYLWYLWFIISFGTYLLTFLKGVGAVISVSPPSWIVYLVFYPGFVLFFAFFAVSMKDLSERNKSIALESEKNKPPVA